MIEKERKENMSIRTILFDLDGTLIDTNQLIMASFRHTFNYFKLNFTDEQIMAFNGPPLVDTFMKIDPLRANEMVETYRTHNHLEHDNYVEAFPKVAETLKALKDMEIKLGIVSTKMAKGVHMGLAHTGITDFFDSIITFDDVANPKPHPEPVFKAIQELDADVHSTLMVGDNFHDIVAGQNAGVQTAAVAWSQKGRDHLLTYKPTFMLENMTDLLQIVDGK